MLYVEEEAEIAESVQRLLASMGVRVVLCTDADVALCRIAEGGFDLLLSDLDLAPLATRLSSRRRPGGGLPVIVLSAYGHEDNLRATRGAGIARHLVKPVNPLQLARALLDGSGPSRGAA